MNLTVPQKMKVARLSKVSLATIYRICSGEVIPHPFTRAALIEALRKCGLFEEAKELEKGKKSESRKK